MSTAQTFTRSLGPNLADAIHICQVTSANITSSLGIQLSVVQTSGLDRNYRATVSPTELTGAGVWKRLVPYDNTEKFLNQNQNLDMEQLPHFSAPMESKEKSLVATIPASRTHLQVN